ncbi:glycosyltransferase family 4 protein [Sphaerimonospora mesophila]|uniref:glycosyltransferase family 4 protein n=1 Tax=Sphaerimonospora mesophila TaxID=37483 RepID=UPI0006E21290
MRLPDRVYAVCSEVPPEVVGGLGRYAERMMPVLGEGGVPVVVFGTAGRGRARRTERFGDVTLHRLTAAGLGLAGNPRLPRGLRLPARTAGLLVFNLRAAVRVLRAEAGRTRAERHGTVVAVHDWMGCPAGIVCGLLGRVPVVFHVHTRELNAAPGRRRPPHAALLDALETVQARMARLIVVPSATMRDELTARGWPADRIRLVPHGFEAPELLRLTGLPDDERDRVRREIRRRYLPGGEGRLIVFAGRLAPHKGVHTLVRAVPRLVEEHPGTRIVLVGAELPQTDDAAVLARSIEETGTAAHVVAENRFLPSAEVFAHFLAADVCVFPSTYEPFGLVAVEAMALGRPVVVGPGFSPEVVGDGALRCVHDDPEELAEALLHCLDDPREAAGLARRGAEHVRRHYSWALTGERTLAVYGEAMR